MARTIFNDRNRAELTERIGRLTPDSQRRWGKFTAPAMICHLKDSIEVAIGEATAAPKKSMMANPLLRTLVIYYMPWPKGNVPTAPEMLLTKPASWDADVATLVSLLDRAAMRGPAGAWAPHPAFGAISGKDYGALIYRHFSHHLTQFGV